MRDDRDRAELVATATAEAVAAGLIVVSADPNGWDYSGPASGMYELTAAEGEKLTDADADGVFTSGLVTAE